MIHFYRKIRKQLLGENNTRKYFKYAVGEILLVVVGILIALQVNNWNVEKSNNNLIKASAYNLINDLEKDMHKTKRIIRQIEKQITYIDSSASYVRSKSIDQIQNLDILYEFNMYYGYKPFTWHTATIEGIKNSGNLSLIKSDSLRTKIASYYSFTKHLDEDFKKDISLSEKLIDYQSKIINTNYPNRAVFLDSVRSYYKKGRIAWGNSMSYKKAKKLNLQILTEDINDIHVLINNLFNYKGNLQTRSEVELPRLISNAQEIIDEIKSEYPNN